MTDMTIDAWKTLDESKKVEVLLAEKESILMAEDVEKKRAEIARQREAALKEYDVETEKEISDLTISRSMGRTQLEQYWASQEPDYKSV